MKFLLTFPWYLWVIVQERLKWIPASWISIMMINFSFRLCQSFKSCLATLQIGLVGPRSILHLGNGELSVHRQSNHEHRVTIPHIRRVMAVVSFWCNFRGVGRGEKPQFMLFWCMAEWTANKTTSLQTTTVRTVGFRWGRMAKLLFLHSQKKKKYSCTDYHTLYLSTYESVWGSGGNTSTHS